MQYDKINILSSIAQKEGKYLGKLAFLLWSYDYEPEEMIVLLDSFVQMKICAISPAVGRVQALPHTRLSLVLSAQLIYIFEAFNSISMFVRVVMEITIEQEIRHGKIKRKSQQLTSSFWVIRESTCELLQGGRSCRGRGGDTL